MKHLLVKNPLGGYGESVIRSGERIETLSHCEIKVVPGERVEGRVRGATWEESEEPLEKYKAALANKPGPDGLICEINASLDIPPEISADPDFWPRIVLLPNGNLLLRARDPEELKCFAAALTDFILRGAPRDRSLWASAEISRGAPHFIGLDYNPQALRRVAAKIAYGMMRLVYGVTLDDAQDRKFREYILSPIDGPEPVSEAPESLQTTTGGTPYHQVILGKASDRSAVIVRLYGYGFRVAFENLAHIAREETVVLCRIDGSGMRLADTHETAKAIADSELLSLHQPWLERQTNSDADVSGSL